MAIGSIFLGAVKKYNQQQIETRFTLVILPLKPLYSMVIVGKQGQEREGFRIKLNRQSVVAGYLRSPLIVGSIAAILIAGDRPGQVSVAIAVILTLAALYMVLFYGRSRPEEQEERALMEELTGIAAMAGWFDEESCQVQYDAMEEAYKDNYGGNNWKNDLHNNNINFQKIPLLYGMALLNAELHPSAESRAMRNKAQMLYRGMKKVYG
ncbi:hypothetical protein HF329_28825 [Chitinophaga oryzae]|uniref:Uncharacterized protein n=1 Tax=Chitinophaga oryzae TaxID=2725414 RepID=A0AAE6ZMX8_9BACT|nr:hypothetical protein [Chitinophaga oryzae]QJB35093.1 hypothetical protein HF329_28825 [Chitinophaga oryzae]